MPLVGLRNSSAREVSASACVICVRSHCASQNAQARHTGAEADGEQVHVDGRPGECGDGELLGLVVGELPERQQRALLAAVLVARVLEVLEVCASQILYSSCTYSYSVLVERSGCALVRCGSPCAISSYVFWFTMRSTIFAACAILFMSSDCGHIHIRVRQPHAPPHTVRVHESLHATHLVLGVHCALLLLFILLGSHLLLLRLLLLHSVHSSHAQSYSPHSVLANSNSRLASALSARCARSPPGTRRISPTPTRCLRWSHAAAAPSLCRAPVIRIVHMCTRAALETRNTEHTRRGLL